ncbi:MAG: DUF1501 domain-containing protein [Planctomycetaceae bacterium]|nr:DUF1501 domain-containing protein [Planctomycetaceae bacterium]
MNTRRTFLKSGLACAAGGALYQSLLRAAELGGGHPLAPKPAHYPAKAKNLLMIFLTGGFSHVDTFDYKPQLNKNHGKKVAGINLRGTTPHPLMGSPFKFTPRGQSGLMISELFPMLGDLADDLCVIRTLHTDIVEHFQSVLAMHTGSATVPMPSLGSWVSYALGTNNPNLPSFMVMSEHLPYAGAQNWDSLFLPPIHQGVRLLPGPEPIAHLNSPAKSVTLRELELTMLGDLNRFHAEQRAGDLELQARMLNGDLARGMMQRAPEIFDLSGETKGTIESYGIGEGDNRSFAWQCLTARRMIERGVRTVELIDTGAGDNWDAHGDMQAHRPKAERVDRAIAALITDLKRRGLFSETLIMICTEFGRTPFTDNGKGRNHYAKAFSSLLCGAGVKGGIAYGETCEHGMELVKDPCHVHDYHATILHLLGLDHEKLTYRYAGRDFRLTDVSGRVLEGVLA